MTITIRRHREVTIPRTITPHTIEIPTHQPLLEERRDIFLMWRITLSIQTNISFFLPEPKLPVPTLDQIPSGW